MRAVRVERFGGPEVVVVLDVPEPVIGPGQVLVRVDAAGIGPWDAWIRAGKSVLPQPLPLTLGSDLSGTVVAAGRDVTAFAPGDEIFGVANARFTDAQAELAAVDANRIAHRPRSLDSIAAAGVPVVAVTASQMLFDHAGVRAGQRVLIHGSSGSVGAFAVQLAHRAGAYVIATESKETRRDALALGADELVISNALDGIAPVDAVIDTVGGEVQQRSFALLRPGGILVSVVSAPTPPNGVRGIFMLVDVTTAALEPLARMFDERTLVARVGTVLPLEDARHAHDVLDGRAPRTAGKMVLRVR